MHDRIPITLSTDEFRHKAGPRLLALGMWVRFAVVGSLAVVGGFIQSIAGEGMDVAVLAFVLGGAALAAVALWRVLALVADTRAPTTGTPAPIEAAGKGVTAERPRNVLRAPRPRQPALAAE